MCLDTVTKKPNKHTHGYKLFVCQKDYYVSPILGNGEYRVGETYSALDENNPLPITAASHGGEYKAGFHYYLKMKDAKKACNPNQVVIRILVKNILATGTDGRLDAGVCESMTLHRIIVANSSLISYWRMVLK